MADTNNNENQIQCNGHEPKMLWDPKSTSLDVAQSQLVQFQNLIETKYNLQISSYNDLYKWSIENFTLFWQEFWHFSKLKFSKPYDKVLDKENESIDNLPFKWFEGALLNYSENLLSCNDDKIALYSFGEAFKSIKTISFAELRESVRLFQIALRNHGIKSGDCVVGYMPNVIECVAAKLATLSLGAVWSCTSPDFGSAAVIERFSQIRPRILFSITAVAYNGKIHNHLEKLKSVVDSLSSLERVVILEDDTKEYPEIQNCVSINEFLSEARTQVNEPLRFEQVPFWHPMVILYSSGTTGTPKCIVHSHGGTLIQHLKEHMLHGNMNRDDIVFYYSTTGWMMYDWLLTALAIGASVVLYDGSPIIPHFDVFWDLVDKIGITHFGTSAKWLAVIEEKGRVPIQTHKLSTLKIIYSTGSPLKPESFSYIYNSIKKDIVVGSITGGSDIISLFCGHNVNLPVYKGELQCRHLGMAVECWNEMGKSVYDECGELVCTKPFPCMPVYFYGDQDTFKKYKSSYFEKFKGVWAHGDFCMINSQTGGVVMLGRSDGTLNPNGVRFGSADIYNAIESLPSIGDSLCVGQKNPNQTSEERVILFIKTKNGVEFDQELINQIKTKIRTSLSPRHVPAIILSIDEIPYTLMVKKLKFQSDE